MASLESGSCWHLVSSAVFVPNSASWLLLQQPSQASQCLFLSPIALCLSPSRLTFPLPSLSFSWLHNPPVPPTILFAAFHHVPSQQTHTLALRFPSASHLSQFLASLQTAASLGAHFNQARLTDHHFLFPSDADIHVDPVNSGSLEEYSEFIPSSACVAQTAADYRDVPVPEAPISTLSLSLSSILNRQTVTSEPTDSRNLDTFLSCLFPATGRLSIPAASSISASRFWEIHNDNALHRQMCNQSHVVSEVEDRQQPSCRRIEDGLDIADDIDSPSFILPLQDASNWPQEKSGLHTRGVDTDASEVLVERVESLVGEIENPANIDLVALADFLALRT